MRPVVKLKPGQYTLADGTVLDIYDSYANYRDAKGALIYNLGMFCSYCEEAYHQKRDLHVEHVQPKNLKVGGVTIYKHLEDKWTNFLLSCATCNGVDNKDTKNVLPGQCHLPHLNNTYLSLVYKAGGVVEVNPALAGDSCQHARNLLELVGLDKTPQTSRPGDTRCDKRRHDWNLAERYLHKYDSGTTDTETIVNLVKNRGGWSIWFTVFKGRDEVRKALIEQIPGTAPDCFDANNHYEPIPRNPHNSLDAV